METYKIVRMYKATNKRPRTMKRGLSLEEAQAHCSLESTRKEGVWFDGYDIE